jgi:hypothetical protein
MPKHRLLPHALARSWLAVRPLSSVRLGQSRPFPLHLPHPKWQRAPFASLAALVLCCLSLQEYTVQLQTAYDDLLKRHATYASAGMPCPALPTGCRLVSIGWAPSTARAETTIEQLKVHRGLGGASNPLGARSGQLRASGGERASADGPNAARGMPHHAAACRKRPKRGRADRARLRLDQPRCTSGP